MPKTIPPEHVDPYSHLSPNTYRYDADGHVLLDVSSRGRKYETVIDGDDLSLVLSLGTTWSVSPSGYVSTSKGIGGKTRPYFLHRWVTAAPKGTEVHHIDGNSLNNTKANLLVLSAEDHDKYPVDQKKGKASLFSTVRGDRAYRKSWTPPCRLFVPNDVRIDGESAYIVLTDRRKNIVGETAVDVNDLPLVTSVPARWYLSNHGYAMANHHDSGKRYTFIMHRVILGCKDSSEWGDHINGNRLDNRRVNLRIVEPAENTRNRRVAKNSKSGVLNVITIQTQWGSFYQATLKRYGRLYRKCFPKTPEGLDAATLYVSLLRKELEHNRNFAEETAA